MRRRRLITHYGRGHRSGYRAATTSGASSTHSIRRTPVRAWPAPDLDSPSVAISRASCRVTWSPPACPATEVCSLSVRRGDRRAGGRQPAGGPRSPAAAVDPGQPTRRLQILIVDDVSTNRELLDEMLARAGFQTHMAASGDEALRICEDWNPDAVLMDVRMPGMDGIEARGSCASVPRGRQSSR